MLQKTFHWLVTGGAGFIGSHTVKELVRQNQHVTVLDNLSGGKLENLAGLQHKITFIKGDICKFSDVLSACSGCDYVLHLAALSSVAKSMANPQQTAEVNVQGTVNVLEAAKQCHVKRVVFSSSATVYGMSTELPCKEDATIDCHSPYAWSKQAGTELCRLYTKIYGVETVILRYFNVFGPGQNPDCAYAAVIAKFMQRAAENKPLEIDWDGLQSRDFVNVKDVVQANILAATKATPGEIYNVASDNTCTILEVADKIEQISGRKLKRIFCPKRPGDVYSSSADISKIRAVGYLPTVTLEEGLREMWAEKIGDKHD